MKKENVIRLEGIVREILSRFDQWDLRVNMDMHPVAVQDLDFWRAMIEKVIASEPVTKE